MTTEKKQVKLVGASVPQPLVDYLELYAVACEKTKSDIFRQLLQKWREDRESVFSHAVLIQNMAAKYQNKWLSYKLDNFNDSDSNDRELSVCFTLFKHNAKKELTRKLSEHTVDEILDNLIL